jgi:hypothetical protein
MWLRRLSRRSAWRPRVIAAIAAACFLTASCGGRAETDRASISESVTLPAAPYLQTGPSSTNLSDRRCEVIWSDGANVAEIDARDGCLDGGELVILGTGSQLCADGTSVGFNAVAWWDKSGTIHRFEVGEEPGLPLDVAKAC